MLMAEYFVIDKNRIKIDEKELKRRLCVSSDFDVSEFGKVAAELVLASTPKACYVRTDISVGEDFVKFPFGRVNSRDLAKNLSGCDKAFVFAVTLGHGVERLLVKKSHLSAAEFFIYDAAGSALIESVCDEAEKIIKGKEKCKPRFSPGYGDVSLDVQRDVLSLVGAERLLGITLTDSCLMIPQKSITAIAGIRN